MFTDLTIIIVNWNLKEDTLECIESLIKSGASLSQIIIVDNGSTDGSIKTLNNFYQNSIFIIDAKENLGFAAGANLGIQYGLSQNYKWFLLLNNDTIVDTDFINEMYKATLNSNRYEILAPIIFYHSNPSTIWYLGDRLIGKTLLTRNYYKNRKIDQLLPALIPIDFTNGCAMMVCRTVFEQIGLLDSSLIMYGEEVDFCWRARLAGFKFACSTPARIWHKISKSSQRDQPRARYLRIRNQVIFYRRYSRSIQLLILIIFTLLRTIRISISDLLRWRLDLILPSALGWFDGWFENRSAIKR
jgi:GT2 family glycosyltransferase